MNSLKDIVLKSIEKKEKNTKDGNTWIQYELMAENPETPEYPTKYVFSELKKDGQPTKAFEDYQKMRPMPGDKLKVGFEETEYSYINKRTGEPAVGKNRNIRFIDKV